MKVSRDDNRVDFFKASVRAGLVQQRCWRHDRYYWACTECWPAHATMIHRLSVWRAEWEQNWKEHAPKIGIAASHGLPANGTSQDRMVLNKRAPWWRGLPRLPDVTSDREIRFNSALSLHVQTVGAVSAVDAGES